MTILNTLYIVVAVILLFGAAIFIHELGHFWVALKLGMKVEEFAIGMGPKMFSFTRNGIVYSIRWIPAGGFVKLPQMITSEALEGHADGTVPPAPPLHKILVAFAGPFMNLVFGFGLATIIYFVGLPVPVNPAIIGNIDPSSPEGKMGIQDGDRIVEVNGKRVTTWQDVTFQVATATEFKLPVVVDHKGLRTTYQLTAEKNDKVGLKWLNLDPQDHPVVSGVIADGPAEKAGLKPNDQFISFGGMPVAGQRQLINLIKERPEKPTDVVILREDKRMNFSITPRLDPVEKVGRIGAMLTDRGTMDYQLQTPGPLPWVNMIEVIEKTYLTVKALVLSKQTGVRASDLSGPVGIIGILAVQVNADWRLALNFMVLLNVNLAFLNLLPIPVLDGGHILMAIVEKIRRKPISTRFVEYTTTAFAVLLISFMLYVTFFDIKRVPLLKAMFKSKAQIEQVEDPKAPADSTPAK